MKKQTELFNKVRKVNLYFFTSQPYWILFKMIVGDLTFENCGENESQRNSQLTGHWSLKIISV